MNTTDEGPGPSLDRRGALAALGTAVSAATGCLGLGGRVSPTATPEPTETPEPLSGTIRVAGSSTVYPMTVGVGEAFSERNPGVTVSVSSTGTGGGFENFFCSGKTPINNASRAITDAERELCGRNGVEPLEIQVATDAITVVVNEDADWVDCVTLAELAAIWRSDGAERWSDVNREWPDEEIELYGPTAASGTYDYFSETINGDERDHRDDYDGTEQDSTIVKGVSGSKYAMGYLGFAYYIQNRDAVKALAVDDDGCVAPSLDAAESGEYTPLSRPLFVYADRTALSDRLVRAFCRFYVETTATDFATEIGYVPVSDEQVRANRRTLEAAISSVADDESR